MPRKLFMCILIPLGILLLPPSILPLHGLTIAQHRMFALLVMTVLFWILEPIPVFATSILIIAIELTAISSQGLIWLRQESTENLGQLLDYKEVMATFASPIIILFLGGFFLAIGATKYKLDKNLARILIKPFGTDPKFLMLGIMLITAVFSMFMSNTATTAMMIAILMPILAQLDQDDPSQTAFLLSVPFAANIGGIGTPIGTPPNAVALKYLSGEASISFVEWMTFGVPLSLVLLVIAWVLLCVLYPARQRKLELLLQGTFLKEPKAIVVYITFAATLILWLSGGFHGMSAYVVAIIPVAVFLSTKVITKEDLKKINWDVLWLISGGIALGLGLEQTGLSKVIIDAIPFDSFSAVTIVLMAAIVAQLMATLMSNTATANLLLPMMATLGSSIPSIGAIGGIKMLVLAVALSCSMGMALPISTPPNALAYATGMIETKTLMKVGGILSSIGIVLILLLMYILYRFGFVS